MYLKRLEVRGFKSFASATRFDLEPGVTAIVGPNGSGKSNVVDALAWVMGEQGARALRGGKMEDVIFAGTSNRPALGRAHVSLTIDNTDQVLPIEYTEVTISRTLFRSGASEYAINGNSCRLLDIQELLSDTGMGRQMHVIVGQGQLDRILQATPEDRRGFVEEAAGVLKFRHRKEKTERKLAALEANLLRLSDLTKEVSRQLTPLGRQAKTARRAQFVQAEVRDAKSRLLADDLVRMQARLAEHSEQLAVAEQNQRAAKLATDGHQKLINSLEAKLKSLQPELKILQERGTATSTLIERTNALMELALERQRNARNSRDQQLERAGGRGGEQRAIALREEQLESLREELAQRHRDTKDIEAQLAEAAELRQQSEEAAEEESRRIVQELQETSRKFREYDELVNKLALLKIESENAAEQVSTLESQLADLPEKDLGLGESERENTELQTQIENVTATYEHWKGQSARVDALLGLLKRRSRELEQGYERQRSKVSALEHELAALNTAVVDLGQPIVDLVNVSPGWEQAAAVLLKTSDALQLLSNPSEFWSAYSSVQAPLSAELRWPANAQGQATRPLGDPPAGQWACELISYAVSITPEHGAALEQLLHGVLFVEDLRDLKVAATETEYRCAVTKAGELFTANGYTYRPRSQRDPLQVRAELSAAQQVLEHLRLSVDHVAERLTSNHEISDAKAAHLKTLQEELVALNAERRVLEQHLSKAAQERRATEQRRTRITEQLLQARVRAEELSSHKQVLTGKLEHTPEPRHHEPDRSVEDQLKAQAQHARGLETELKLRLRSVQSETRSAEQQVHSMESNIQQEQRRFRDARQRAIRAQAQITHCLRIHDQVSELLSSLTQLRADTENAVEDLEGQVVAVQAELDDCRIQYQDLQRAAVAANDRVHQLAMAQQDSAQRYEHTIEQAREELGMTAEFLIENYGPDQPVPITEPESHDKWAELRVAVDEEGNPVAETKPFDRGEQEQRLRRATKDLAALGRFNPLALEEFTALQERHDFLSGQLEDLTKSKQDLLAIIRDVDDHVERVFAEAFNDTAKEFELIFAKLFPGGEGRLVLTDPEDMRATGIEVEAKPAGKKIKRLSLLSGGERSLTALAMLIAIFKARPSPFYVMDEVEAALDDTNLGRLLGIFKELQQTSQLVIITHQKRTMEIADALYGVSMRGDGVSKVITQKVGSSED